MLMESVYWLQTAVDVSLTSKVVRLVSVVAVRGVNTVQLAAFRRVVEFASHDARQEN